MLSLLVTFFVVIGGVVVVAHAVDVTVVTVVMVVVGRSRGFKFARLVKKLSANSSSDEIAKK